MAESKYFISIHFFDDKQVNFALSQPVARRITFPVETFPIQETAVQQHPRTQLQTFR
jgi:hypothetical protein